jgi:hypothetical protein
MIPTIKNYSCPFCIQKSSRRFNMEIHIKRRHGGMNLPLNNRYRVPITMSSGYPSYNPKLNYSSNMVHNGEDVWGKMNNNQQEDFMDGCINTLRNHEEFLRIQVEIKDLSSRLMSPYYPTPYPQQFYYPITSGHFIQKSPNFSTLSFQQSSLASPACTAKISTLVSDRNVEKSFQLVSLRGSICDKCLTIDTIPLIRYKDGTLKEIYNHSCSEDRVLDLKRRDKHDLIRFFGVLHRFLLNILAINVVLCNKSQAKISLSFMKHDGLSSSSSNTETYSSENLNCPIRSLNTFPSESQWINQIKNSQKQGDIIELETKELLSFLEISIDSTMIILKIKRDSSLSSSENYDFYIVGLNLSEPNLEMVIKSFAPKFRN